MPRSPAAVRWDWLSRKEVSRGEKVFLDPRMAVHQHRPTLGLGAAYRERMEWGRVFAETRVAEGGVCRGLLYAGGTPLLPVLLLARVARHMARQGRRAGQMVKTLPLALCLLTGWAFGELLGYISGPPSPAVTVAAARLRTEQS